MSQKMRFAWVDPKKIKIPAVRVTSAWEPEDFEVFKASLEADGISNPLQCVKEGETWWLSDGKHRLEQALLKGEPKVPVAFKEGTLVDAKLRNLYSNRLRGKTKASEEVALIGSLTNEDHLSLEEIQKRTGLSREVVEQRLAISRALPEVKQALDQEQIPVGVAFQLSRLPQATGQLKLLVALLQHIPPMTTDEVRRIVDESLKIIATRSQTAEEPKPDVPIPTFKCRLCEQKWPINEGIGINIDHTCLGLAKDYIQQLLAQRRKAKTPEQILAEQAATVDTTTPSPS